PAWFSAGPVAAQHRGRGFGTAVNTSLYAASATSLLPTLPKPLPRHSAFACKFFTSSAVFALTCRSLLAGEPVKPPRVFACKQAPTKAVCNFYAAPFQPTKFFSSCIPASALFSGWNWVAKILLRVTAAANFTP